MSHLDHPFPEDSKREVISHHHLISYYHPRLGQWPFPHQIVVYLWGHRNLIRQLTYRELVGRYKGSFLGILWSFLTPLLLLVIYTFIFSKVFKVRWGVTQEESKVAFAIMLFAGLLPYQLFTDAVSRAPGLILSYPTFVKKVVFPLEVLPIVIVNSALIHSFFGLSILLICGFISIGSLFWTALLLPAVLVPLVLLTLGFTWFLASLGVFVCDIGHGVGLSLTALAFLSPVFYPLSMVPDSFRFWMQLNPLTVLIESYRQMLLLGQEPEWIWLGVMTALSTAVAYGGFVWFMRSKRAFGDVI